MARRSAFPPNAADSLYRGNDVRVLQHILYRVPPNAVPEVRSAARKKANWILAAILIPLTLLTLAAMAFMWPSGSKEGITLASPYAAAPGVTFDTGKIQRVVVGSCSDVQAGGDAAQQGTSSSAAERGLSMHVRLH